MNYAIKKFWKILLLVFAANIALFSIFYTNNLVKKLANEERKNMQIWAEAVKLSAMSPSYESEKENDELENFINQTNIFYGTIIQNNKNIPAMLVDNDGNINSYVNLDTSKIKRKAYLDNKLLEMKNEQTPIEVLIDKDSKNYIYYENSLLLNQLRIYPYYQLSLVALFLIVSYFLFSSARRSEQNRVWVGLAKETAHQLGTPISSLMAWVEMLRLEVIDKNQYLVDEMQKDVHRLELVAERFSKIGSDSVLITSDMKEIITQNVDYLSKRVSSKVSFHIDDTHVPQYNAQVNRQLIDWVIENLCKNAIDAMEGVGDITFIFSQTSKFFIIDIKDTGKGIPNNKFKTVFQPGYSTKKRGWGLGLSLAKRIVESYHHGQIFVKESSPIDGTTFRIMLRL